MAGLKAKTKKHCIRSHRFALALTAMLCAPMGYAQALQLPDQPLLSTAGVDPNVMLFMDNSGSMGNFVLGYYDSDYDYADCPRDLALDAPRDGEYIEAKVDYLTRLAYFTYYYYEGRGRGATLVSKDYQWGTEVTGNDQYPVACFKDTRSSSGNDNLPGATVYYNIIPAAGSSFPYQFDGNQMNYYFSNADQTGPDYWPLGNNKKPGSDTRLAITKRAGETLINSLSGKRIGLAAFEQVAYRNETAQNGGAEILAGIQDIDGKLPSGLTQREYVIEQMNSLRADGFTPIGETLSDIARYFITGYDDQEIVIHPNEVERRETVTASAVFSGTPIYASGVSAPGTGDDAVIQESCQSNYVIALTDGEPNETGLVSRYLRGALTGDNRGNDRRGGTFVGYDTALENRVENLIMNGSAVIRDIGSLNDVTMAMYDIDLRPDLNAQEKVNIKTFFVGGFEESLQDNEELTRAAANGVGQAPEGVVYPASNQTELEEAFRKIFELVDSDKGSRSTVSFNAGSIDSDTALYQATYDFAGTQWAGDVKAYAYNANGTNALFSNTASWSANEILTKQVAAATLPGLDGRQIITMSAFTNDARDGTAFTDDNTASFSQTMLDDLDGDGSDPSTTIPKVVNYLRGYEYPEEFRERIDGGLGILGDIVNSSPVEINAPELAYTDAFGDANNRYSAFAKKYENRKSVVYVGANDGMLHAFDGDVKNGGSELFAYIPSMVADDSSDLEGLYYLTDPTYQHRFYVDGSIGVSDVFIDPDGGTTTKSWRTVLLGTLGLGGKGIYALDITDPAKFTETNAGEVVLWEFDGNGGTPTTGDNDMGHIFGEPKISKMNDGRFAVIVGNGVNSTNESAVLFIIFIEQGADGSWDAGDWIKIDTGSTGGNGLSTPALVDFDGDLIVDRIYAGDVKGQMWGFDVSSTKSAEWGLAHGTGTPLFTATDSSGSVQPITSAPLVVRNEDTPSANNEPNVLVLFGTGQLWVSSDIGNTDEQAFYGVWDRGQGGLKPSDLLERKLVNKIDGTVVGRTIDESSTYSDPVAWYDGAAQKQYGWYIPLPDSGERVIIQPAMLLGTIFFFSSVPQETTCSAGGYGYLNFITAEGLETTTPVFDFNGDGVIDSADEDYVSQKTTGDKGLPAGSQFIGAGEAQNSPCANGNGLYQAYTTIDGALHYRWVCPGSATGVGRMAWQELFGE